jgi:hypothetical protein
MRDSPWTLREFLVLDVKKFRRDLRRNRLNHFYLKQLWSFETIYGRAATLAKRRRRP